MLELLQDFLHTCRRERGLSDKTLTGYSDAAQGWIRWLRADSDREPTLADWTEQNARAFHTYERNRGIRQSTCRMRVAALRSWGNWLEQMHGAANPWRKVKTLVNEELRQPCPNQDTMRALFDACDRVPNANRGKMLKAAIALGSLAGLREFEIVAVRVEDLHMDVIEPYVFVKAGKGRKAGRVPLGRLACSIFSAWLAVRPETTIPNLLVLRGKKLGDRPYTQSAFDRGMALLKRIGKITEDVTTQALRRFGGTSVAQQHGATVADAQKFLRHSSPATTLRYIKSTNSLAGFADGIMKPTPPPPASQTRRTEHESRPHHLQPVPLRKAPRKP